MQVKKSIVHFITSLERGGAQVVLRAICTLPLFEHHVVYIHDGSYKKELEYLGIQLHQIQGFVTPFDPIFFIRLYFFLKKIRPDKVHSMLWAANWSARIVCRILGLPLVCSLHNNCEQNGMVRNTLEKIMPAYGTMIAVSEQVRQSYIKTIARAPMAVIPNGIQKPKMMQPFTKQHLGLRPDDFIIGSVGRFELVKRYDQLLAAFAQLIKRYPHIRLLLIGVGSLESSLRADVKKMALDDAVLFKINVSAAPYYPVFDLFILPSLKEGISMALLEAMSNEVPCVVASDTPTHSVIEHNKNGLIAYPGSKLALLMAIEQLIKDKALAKKLAYAGKKTVEMRFSEQQMLDSYAQIFKQEGI